MTIGFTGLRATGLAHVGGDAVGFAKGNELLDVGAHGSGDADDDFEVGLDAGPVSGFLCELDVAIGVGDCAGFFVEAG